jgi:N-acyl-D-amino-acid deacylase
MLDTMQRALVILISLLAASSNTVAGEPASLKPAIEKALRRLDQGSANYIKNRKCFSCHHQAVTILSMTSAGKRGFAIEPIKLRQQVDFTLDTFRPKLDRVSEGKSVPGASTMTVYALFTLEAAAHPADDTTDALVRYLLVRQNADGSWSALARRPPTEGSPFTNTALGVRALRVYGIKKDDDEHNRLVTAAIERGKEWLKHASPKDTEDRAFHLHGLVELGEASRIAAARAALLKEQREDGSWSQLPGKRDGDAYATATVLMALRRAGLGVDDPVYRKGMKYLLTTQKEDGSWLVETRSRPVQEFFDNGDPGGKSQFISFAATGWATLALLEALP